MEELFFSSYFWIGLVCGAIIVFWLKNKQKMIKKISLLSSVKLAEELQTAFRNEDIKGIEKFKDDYLNRKEMYIFGKASPSAYQLWAAIVLYVAHRYADYNYNSYDSAEWTEIVEKTFGNKSIALSKFKAVDEILNRATKYFMSEYGNIKNQKTARGSVSDYGEDALYEMIGYIIASSFETTISFGKYSDVEDPADNYDHGAYLLANMQLDRHENVEGIKNMEKAALSGMPEAQCKLGLIYAMGERVVENRVLAHQWFMKAAENGSAMGMFFTGEDYYNGSAGEQDNEKAIYWLQKSADLNYSQAEDLLGILYLNGEIVNRDITKAFDLLNRAANHGEAHSQYTLAVMYARGVEINFDEKQAMYWFKKAVETDSRYSQYSNRINELIKNGGAK